MSTRTLNRKLEKMPPKPMTLAERIRMHERVMSNQRFVRKLMNATGWSREEATDEMRRVLGIPVDAPLLVPKPERNARAKEKH